MWEKPACNICGNKKQKPFLGEIATWEHPEKFNIVECKKCRLKFLSPRPTSAYIGKYYQSESYWGENLQDYKVKDNGRALLRKKQDKNIYREILAFKKAGSIFDIGAGTGTFLANLKNLGWKVGGIEFSKDAVAFAKRVYKINLKRGDFNKLTLSKKKFDVITFNNSLEHLYDPKGALRKARQMLKKDGLIVVTVPNIESLGQLIFKKRWLPLHPPKHLYHFSDETLTKMLKNADLKSIKVNHWCFHHAYYGVFQSMRYALSPKFSSKLKRDNINSGKKISKNMNRFSVKKEIGKLIASFVACVIVVFGYVVKKGETITIYAKKS